jgi:spermidine synthase
MNATYPLLPVSLLTILAYFTTWLFSYWGIFSLKSHRKGWNYLLLISFLITGLLGLFSVIKINYNLEVEGYEQLLRWHVSFGIAMVVISLFHLSWHLKYYFSANGKRQEITTPNTTFPENNTSKAGYLLFLLGTITIINQTVFIREFIGILSGNELIIGVVMAFWLLLTGWGAYRS